MHISLWQLRLPTFTPVPPFSPAAPASRHLLQWAPFAKEALQQLRGVPLPGEAPAAASLGAHTWKL